jgi:hypothetical protein
MMTNHQACALCINRSGYLDLEVQTTHGNTGIVRVCWPCLEKRVKDLMHDLRPSPDSRKDRFDGIFGFRVGIAVTR